MYCYATGDVSASGILGTIGGLLGDKDGSDASVVRCYSTGAVSSTFPIYVGGLLGRLEGGSLSNSFYDSETSGRSDDDGRPRSFSRGYHCEW